jgi:hypothetical protein
VDVRAHLADNTLGDLYEPRASGRGRLIPKEEAMTARVRKRAWRPVVECLESCGIHRPGLRPASLPARRPRRTGVGARSHCQRPRPVRSPRPPGYGALAGARWSPAGPRKKKSLGRRRADGPVGRSDIQ